MKKQPENVPMNSAHNDIPAGVVDQQNLSPGLTVVVKRRIRPGREAEFEQTMRSFVQFALAFPGHRGISVLRPAAGSRDYIVVDKFSDESARVNFKATSQYQDWMGRLGELTEGDPRIEELTGLEGWFTLPEDPGLARPRNTRWPLRPFWECFLSP